MTRVNGTPRVIEGVVDIQWAPGGKRIRRVVKRSNKRITGKLPSWKMGRMLHWESKLERDALYLHEADPAVTFIREQPVRLRFMMNGELRSHVPDFYVETNGKKIFREVKTTEDAALQEIRERTDVLKQLLPIHGFEYDVITDEEIKAEPRLENAKWITRLGKDTVSLVDEESIRRKIAEKGHVKWSEVKKDCFGDYSVPKACRLILEGNLRIDINKSITGDARVSYGEKGKGGNHNG
ncbi:TnsA endonuclease N-terminal domain-containing protein [Thiohalophilus sp.]|uniref:TnsA endonuclease N-terminal domain-containing protein n=1 Tax=Thiohalophilus sp. TaxID=3028392 RepID=UPI002ACE61E6|nr:TnsA endonuclease N-terminal domain-containing protein [Thiohalophilus sp.]MDZ7660923.1 TnsA endonuclease N-terminal domain-containing protein [Thiohalophilus sp.]